MIITIYARKHHRMADATLSENLAMLSVPPFLQLPKSRMPWSTLVRHIMSSQDTLYTEFSFLEFLYFNILFYLHCVINGKS